MGNITARSATVLILGRDTDSIGVMIGVILGAMHGASVISEDDRIRLDTANRLDLTQLADQFSELAKEVIVEDLKLNTRRQQLLAE